jgi:hypothetical protein
MAQIACRTLLAASPFFVQVFFIAAEARRAAVDYMAAHGEVKNFVVVPQ